MYVVTAETIGVLMGVAGLDFPPERKELLAKRFGPMLALTSRLSLRMAGIDNVAPINMFQAPASDTDGVSMPA
jgi:hypothetical protein